MKSKYIILLCCSIIVASIISSCKSKEEKENQTEQTSSENTDAVSANNEELKAYMLGGIYTINGYGGLAAVQENVSQNAGDDKEKQLEAYKQLLSFPFEQGMEGPKEALSNMWSVNSKEDLLKTLEKLQNGDPKSKHKAWDYARLVNNVHLGYAAGYLTKEEGNKWVIETLPKAKAAFKTWDEYFADFAQGRKEWNPEDEEAATFEELSKTLPTAENSIYKTIPLN